jgi:hypothetical protein
MTTNNQSYDIITPVQAARELIDLKHAGARYATFLQPSPDLPMSRCLIQTAFTKAEPFSHLECQVSVFFFLPGIIDGDPIEWRHTMQVPPRFWRYAEFTDLLGRMCWMDLNSLHATGEFLIGRRGPEGKRRYRPVPASLLRSAVTAVYDRETN